MNKTHVSQIDKLIASLSSDTVIKLIKMLQRDIRHSFQQIELLTGQQMTIRSKRWSAEKVSSAKLTDIIMQEDLWAVYVRGFTDGYRSTKAKSHFNSQKIKQELEVESNITLKANTSPLGFCQNSKCVLVSKQETQPDASVTLPVLSIDRHEFPITFDEGTANPCFDAMNSLKPLEIMVIEPDIQSYFDTQMIKNSSLELYENVILFNLSLIL